jgi:hypothetical protein
MTLPSVKDILIGKQYVGVEHFSVNDEEKIALLLVENKKGELITNQKNKVTYKGQIPEQWDKKLPFYLVVNSNQVIQKEVTIIDNSNEKLLHKAFPNLNWNEFYYEIWRLKTKSVIAITRKNYIHELISQYQKQGILIIGISLGICSIAQITDYSQKTTFVTNNQNITITEENQTITTHHPKLSILYDINGLSVENSWLLAFSGILRLLVNNNSITGNLTNYNHQLQDNYHQKSFFNKGFQIIVGTLLTILLLNFFVFNHYYRKAQDTSEKIVLNNSSKEEMLTIKERVTTKEKKLQQIVGTTAAQCSSMINEITRKVPSSILLSELIYNPLDKKIKPEEPIIVQQKRITISGTTISNVDFTKWIEQTEKLPFVNEVVIIHFGKSETAETTFTIKLLLK